MTDRYGADVLASNPHRRPQVIVPQVEAEFGLVVECAATGYCGSVVRTEKSIEGITVELEDRHGARRLFVLRDAAFLIDGQPVTLVRPQVAVVEPIRTASGSVATKPGRAQAARGSRILVEGTHDAELVERIWGDDLRAERVVVEPLHGADNLVAWLADFRPDPERKIGVLLDHLIPGSKEQRLADEAMARFAPYVHVVGHPYVDVWQAVRPQVLGFATWPVIPKGESWKAGILRELDWPEDERLAWKRILRSVTTFTDLEPSMLGRVEELIDFVTVPA